MRVSLKLLLLFFLLFCIDLGSFQEEINKENVYFPDQIEYIQLMQKYCKGDLIYWPDGRCYKVGEQGPCNFGRVLQIDRRFLLPFSDTPQFYTFIRARCLKLRHISDVILAATMRLPWIRCLCGVRV
ncbi:uncharacterized protein LOC117171960 [Belonocnema kinseyi]|uniref:uncharacterized protein LOC117171960 n=1 Tax=Belonocnema kinseyi TaxID=2817044 RepID=UPI00143DBC60|nr:uncharacterized protein LOC117171960 [Belonocnema kinseyi]